MVKTQSTKTQKNKEKELSLLEKYSWRSLVCFILSVVGLGIASYLTYAHFVSGTSLACPQNATFNCEKVTTSPESYVLGIPVALLGLAYFVVEVIINYPAVWKARSSYVAYFRVLMSVGGMGFVIYLISQELLVIKAVCLWCTSIHVIEFLLFLLTITGWYDTGYKEVTD
jgi:uncharacterized membrane protein